MRSPARRQAHSGSTRGGWRQCLGASCGSAVAGECDVRTSGHENSPTGDMGMVWKAVYPDGKFDEWSSVSVDGGPSFKTVRVSHALSPEGVRDRCNFMMGDDLSSIDIDSKFLYVVWGDNRSGFEGAWFGQVPLSAFK
jgi:hypothetical protein